MPIMPLKLNEEMMDRCTACDNMILKCVCGVGKPLDFKVHDFGTRGESNEAYDTVKEHATVTGELVMADGVIAKPNLGFPLCPVCKDSTENCIY